MLDEENEFYYIGNTLVELTPLETRTLSYLIEHKDRIVLHDELINAVFEEQGKKPPNKLVQLIHRLNKKLKYELCIQSKKNVGYKMTYIGKRVL